MSFVARLLCPLLCFSCFATPAAAVDVGLIASPSSVVVGETVRIGVTISGLTAGNAPGIGAFDIDIGFDPGVLALEAVNFGNGLDALGLGTFGTSTPGDGVINVYELSLDSPDELIAYQSGSFELFALGFHALSAGNVTLSIGLNALADAHGNPLPASGLGTSVSVTAVPEAQTCALLLIGLASLVARRARARRIEPKMSS